VRQLKSGVTVAMRVRRDTAGGTGDDDEADVSFDTSFTNPTISLDSAISNASAGVTATTLGEFLNVGTVNSTTYSNPDSLSGTASCFVNEWEDQSGNSNHASQATFGSQPQIHSGTVNTDLITENGKPAIEWDGTDDILLTVSVLDFSAHTTSIVFGTDSIPLDADVTIMGTGGTNGQFYYANTDFGTASNNLRYYLNAEIYVGSSIRNTGQVLTTFKHDSGTSSVYLDGSLDASGSISLTVNDIVRIGAHAVSGREFPGPIQEFIFWETAQSDSNRTGIETNINGFFGIY